MLGSARLFLRVSISFFPILNLLYVLHCSVRKINFAGLTVLSKMSRVVTHVVIDLCTMPVLNCLTIYFNSPAT